MDEGGSHEIAEVMIRTDGFGCRYCLYNNTFVPCCNLNMVLEYSIGKGCEQWAESGKQRFYSGEYYEEHIDKYLAIGVFENPDAEDALCNYLTELLNRPMVKIAALADPLKSMIFKRTIMRFIYSVLDRVRFDFQKAQTVQNRIREALTWTPKRISHGWQGMVKDATENFGDYGFPGNFYKRLFSEGENARDPKMWETMCLDWNRALMNKLKKVKEDATEQSKKNFETQWSNNQKNIESYLDATGTSQEQFRQCWNMMNGLWTTFDFERLLKQVKLQMVYPEISEIVGMMGRKSNDNGEDWMALKQGSTQQFEHASHSDIYGVTTGHDLGSLLPSELALFMDDKTENVFIQKYLSDQLQVFRYKSEIMNPERSLNKKPAARRGPMIICLDTSGSMDGKPQKISQSLVIKAVDVAMKEKRQCFLIAFSVSIKPIDVLKECQNIIGVLQKSPTGNTNATQMLDATFKLLESNPEYINADVLWVTDFVMNLVSEDRLEKMQTLRSEGTRFYGLRIGLNQHQWEPYFDQIKTIGYVDSQVY